MNCWRRCFGRNECNTLKFSNCTNYFWKVWRILEDDESSDRPVTSRINEKKFKQLMKLWVRVMYEYSDYSRYNEYWLRHSKKICAGGLTNDEFVKKWEQKTSHKPKIEQKKHLFWHHGSETIHRRSWTNWKCHHMRRSVDFSVRPWNKVSIYALKDTHITRGGKFEWANQNWSLSLFSIIRLSSWLNGYLKS